MSEFLESIVTYYFIQIRLIVQLYKTKKKYVSSDCITLFELLRQYIKGFGSSPISEGILDLHG